jgi:uncharacterized protein DUF4157
MPSFASVAAVARQAPKPAPRQPSTSPPSRRSSPRTAPPSFNAPPVLRLNEGKPLDWQIRRRMEKSFATDLGAVRVHRNTGAAATADRMGAKAFAYGPNIVLGSRGRANDLGLMAHETAHTIQQRGHRRLQRFSRHSGDAHESEARGASAAVVTGSRFAVTGRTNGSRVQGDWLPDLPNPLDWIAGKANLIPGFRMFTIILGVNPINMSAVDAGPANILRALIEIMPGGGLITEALDNSGVFEKVAAWGVEQVKALGLVGSAIKEAVTAFIAETDLTDLITDPSGVWARGERIFTEPIDRIKSFAEGLVDGIIAFVKEAILKPLAVLASKTKGWDLLCAVLGANPITGESVTPSAEVLIGGFMKLIGEEEVWARIQKTGAIGRCWEWFQSTMNALVGFVSQIPDLAIAAFKALELWDIVLVPRALIKVGAVFANFLGDFFSWAGSAMWDLLEIVFDVVSPGAWEYIQKTGAALQSILKNPLPFMGNLVKAAKLGFQNFASHFLTHLKNGLLDWLTGSLPGVYIPKAISLPEVGKFALSVLGITWAKIRGKIVKALGPNGEKIMAGLEFAFDVILALKDGGPAAAWKVIQDKLTALKDQVIGGITSMVTEMIVTKAVPKLVAMFIPGAGFISALVSIYDTIMVFVDKISKIVQVVTGFLNSIVAIANGVIDAAAAKVESVLAGLLSLAISFLAGFAGLGKVADKVRDVIKRVQEGVDKAIDAAIAWIIAKAKALFAKLFGKDKKGKPDERTDAEKMRDLKLAVDAGTGFAKEHGDDIDAIRAKLGPLKDKYRLTKFDVVDDGGIKHHLFAEINPPYTGPIFDAANLEELLSQIPAGAKTDVRNAVKDAVDKKKAIDAVFAKAKAAGAVKPTKTMSVMDGVTISGWGTYDQALDKLTKGRMVQQTAEVHDFITTYAAGLAKYGYSTKAFIFDPSYAPGAYYKSHAEKQAFIGALDRLEKDLDTAKKKAVASIGVTRPICPDDCFPFFKAVSQMQGRTIVLADPVAIWVFGAGGELIRRTLPPGNP